MNRYFSTGIAYRDTEKIRYYYEIGRDVLHLPPGGVLLALAHQMAFDQFGRNSVEDVLLYYYDVGLISYPKARAELNKKIPDPYEYAWGLSAAHSKSRYSYSPILNYPGGAWRLGRTLAQWTNSISNVLHDSYGFTFQDDLLNVPVMDFNDIYEVMRTTGASEEECQLYLEDVRAIHGGTG